MNKYSKSVLPTVLMVLVFTFTAMASTADEIKWYTYDEGMALAKQEKKKVYINFHADWCGYCHKMVKKTFKDKSVISFLNEKYIPIRLNSDKERKLSAQYGVRGLPANWFVASNGDKIGNQPGYLGPKDFLKILKFVHEEKYKTGKK